MQEVRAGSVGDNSSTFCTSKTQNWIRSMKLAVLQILGTLRSDAGQAGSVLPSSLGGAPWVLGVGAAVVLNKMTKALMGEGILPWGRASGKPQGRSCPYQGCSAPTEGDSRGLWDVRPPASHPQASAGPTLPTHRPCHLLATPEAAPPPMEAP